MRHHYEVTLSAPLSANAGDVLKRVGNTLQLWRSGNLVTTRSLTVPTEVTPEIVPTNRLITNLFYVEEDKMPGVMATLTGVEIAQDGKYYYRFSDGSEREYNDRAAALLAVQDLDTNSATAKDFLVLASLRKDNGGAKADVMVGRCCTLDATAQSPLSLSVQLELG